MEFPAFKIEREGKKDPARKTRVFETRLLGYLAADSLWESPRAGDHLRPVWIAYLGTERETHPFTANLRGGARARAGGDAFQIPKRAPYRWSTQKVPGGLVTVAYLPELFHLEPALPFADDVRFILAPPRWWVDEQAAELAPEFGEDAPDVARAALFCAFLDRRTPLPLVHDLRFHLQLYRAAQATGWIHHPGASRYQGAVLHGRGAEACGLEAPLACRVDQKDLSAFIVEQTSLWHREELRRGKPRRAGRPSGEAGWPVEAGGRRLSLLPSSSGAQLGFDFG